MVLGLVVGSTAGWHLEDTGASLCLPDGRIWPRGEWMSFAQFVAVLVFRYATVVATAINSWPRRDAGLAA